MAEEKQSVEKSATGANVQANSLETIREILFGETSRSVDHTLQTVADRVAALEERVTELEEAHAQHSRQLEVLDQANSDEHKALQQSLETMGQTLTSRLNQLDLDKVAKTQIGEAFVAWGQAIQQSIQE